MLWIVGKNRHTGEWATGGTRADYPAEHWDVYHVEAKNRDQARKVAQQEHRKEMRRKGRASVAA